MTLTGTVVVDVVGSTTYRALRIWAALRVLRRRRRAARSPELDDDMGWGG